jgi:hypothetical protein
MDLSSFQGYRELPRSSYQAFDRSRAEVLSPRGKRVLRDLVLLAAIAVMLFGLRELTKANRLRTAPPKPPLPFEVVMKRYGELRWLTSHEQVEEIIGPPTERHAGGPDLQDAERHAEHSHRHLGIPSGRYWNRWVDPEDGGRWVAVLYAGPYRAEQVYWILKKGF